MSRHTLESALARRLPIDHPSERWPQAVADADHRREIRWSSRGGHTAGSMQLLVTGGSGVLGRALQPLAQAAGHDLHAPTRDELDLFDPVAVADAVRGVDAVLHLASRIQPLEELANSQAWRENDRLRADASRVLVDAALAGDVAVYVRPTVTFVYPAQGAVSEETAIANVAPILQSTLTAERETDRFAQAGRRGVVLRLGLLDGPGTGHDEPIRAFGASLHVSDAGRALLSALSLPRGGVQRLPRRRTCVQ